MAYKEIVHEIAGLPWHEARPEDIVFLSLGTAQEFAESLRLAGKLYPEDPHLREMMEGELETDNMVYEDYRGPGDHWQYLEYFVRKLAIKPSSEEVNAAIESYRGAVRELSFEERAMAVFSREEELTHIFEKLLHAHDWRSLGYGFYMHYLASHIEFDSGEAGHHYLTQHFPLHERALERFYQARRELYQNLFCIGRPR